MTSLLALYALAIGAVIGSFLNVVIHRYPREESIVFPPSHCPNCHYQIRWFDNVPVLSWLALRGRCRNCKVPISLRYPLIELANALFYLAIFQRTGISIFFIPLAAIVSMTIVLIYIDLEIQILPDVIDLPGILIGLGIGFAGAGDLFPELQLTRSLTESLIGATVGGGVIVAIALTYRLLRRIEGMGFGDAKMMAMIGAVTGWQAALVVLFLGSVLGAIIGVPVALRSEKKMQAALPFGVFLGLAFLILLFFGPQLFLLYLGLI